MPIDIPIADKRKEIGKTTEIAPMASSPIYCPTKKVSTTMFNDMTIKPIAAGIAWVKSNFLIGDVPKRVELFLVEFKGFYTSLFFKMYSAI